MSTVALFDLLEKYMPENIAAETSLRIYIEELLKYLLVNSAITYPWKCKGIHPNGERYCVLITRDVFPFNSLNSLELQELGSILKQMVQVRADLDKHTLTLDNIKIRWTELYWGLPIKLQNQIEDFFAISDTPESASLAVNIINQLQEILPAHDFTDLESLVKPFLSSYMVDDLFGDMVKTQGIQYHSILPANEADRMFDNIFAFLWGNSMPGNFIHKDEKVAVLEVVAMLMALRQKIQYRLYSEQHNNTEI